MAPRECGGTGSTDEFTVTERHLAEPHAAPQLLRVFHNRKVTKGDSHDVRGCPNCGELPRHRGALTGRIA